MNQFVAVVPVPDESFVILPSYLMQYVMLKFGVRHLIVLDDGTPFNESFIAICEALNLNHNVLTKPNHKGLTVEHSHRFLHTSVTIAAEECDTNDIFVLASVAADCAWNSAPIDGTDIIRSIPAIGRELHFPLDTSLNDFTKLTHNKNQAAFYYLKLTDFSRHFSAIYLKKLY